MSTTDPRTPGQPLSLAAFRQQRRDARRSMTPGPNELSRLDRLACWITDRVGTMGFFLVIAIWTILWLGWNLLAPQALQFDPPMAFVLWLFISNLIQLHLMPLIMIGQNVQARHAERRAEYDLKINVQAEKEIEVVLEHLEYQNRMLIAMVAKLGVTIGDLATSHREPR